MFIIFFASIFTGDLTLVVKDGLSIRIVNSYASKNGFLKSIVGGLGPCNLNGPLGCGDNVYPYNKQVYSPPSGDVIVIKLLNSDRDEGSNFIFKPTSTPS